MQDRSRFSDSLLSAIRGLLKSVPNKSLKEGIDLAEDLIRDQVCHRCILRICKHTHYDDYLLAPPGPAELLHQLRHAACASAPAGSAHEDTNLGSIAAPDTNEQSSDAKRWPDVCSVCVGVLQHLTGAGDSQPVPTEPVSEHLNSVAVSGVSADMLAGVLRMVTLPHFHTIDVSVDIPVAMVLRERMLAEHLAPRWRPLLHKGVPQFVRAEVVLRHMLAPQLASLMGVRWQDGAAGLTVVLKAEYAAERHELRPLVEEGVQFQLRCEQSRPHGGGRNAAKRTRRAALGNGAAGSALDAIGGDAAAAAEKADASDQGADFGAGEANAAAIGGCVAAGAVKSDTPGSVPAAGTVAADAGSQPAVKAGVGSVADSDESAAAAAAAAAAATAGPDAASDDSVAVTRETDVQLNLMDRARMAAFVANKPGGVLRRVAPWPPSGAHMQPAARCVLRLQLLRPAVYLAGRYLKTVRGMPQTKWFDPDTGQRIGCVSLAERVQDALAHLYDADDFKFISGGREDADVRMLGDGRPFVLEITNPKRPPPSADQLHGVEKALEAGGHGARCVALAPCTRASLERIKEAEESKEKTYGALCWAATPPSADAVEALLRVQKMDVAQDTPLRVLHRRAPKVRMRWVTIEAVDVLPSDPHYFNLRMRTQAGTYVKEFCHGDLGRTQPSLGTLLGCCTEILQLDVLAVHMSDWP